ncbi:MAG: arsA1 [Herbinix sp.]|jgi:arsenite-transporting ATPase|nr:arsA1 [Herbinix sp.]
MRIILYTGKGGVGKTCVAAATACQLAASGKKVLVMSTDQAHSLGDALDYRLGPNPIEVTQGLYAMEVDAITECERAWGSVKDYLHQMMISKSGDSLEAEELLVFPGFEELTSLFMIKDLYDENIYDVIIVDCAPTGETLSLLKFPEMFGGWISQILPMKRKAMKIAGPAVSKLMKIPMPKDTIFDEIEVLIDKMNALRELLWDKDIVSIRIVTTPEKIVMKEAKRNFSYLHLFNYNVDAIIVNRIYPKESMSGYFHQWMKNQEEALEDIKESFAGVPIFYLELLKHELRTIDRLSKVAIDLYGECKPEAILYRETIFRTVKEGDKEIFVISLPFFELKDMELLQKGDELTLIIKNERRRFILPGKLKDREIQSAKYEEGVLKLSF